MKPSDLLKIIRQKKFLASINNAGQELVWFSHDMPEDFPTSEQLVLVREVNVDSYGGAYTRVSGSSSGWISYDLHTGGKIHSFSAFMAINPSDASLDTVKIFASEIISTFDSKGERYQYALEGDWLDACCSGVLKALNSVMYHPISGTDVTILNVILDGNNSDLVVTERVSKKLIQELITDLYRSNNLDVVSAEKT
jgi:hypothetical protein